MALISFRLSRELLAELDDLVLSSCEFRYRSNAINRAIEDLINLEQFDDYQVEQYEKQLNWYVMSVIPS